MRQFDDVIHRIEGIIRDMLADWPEDWIGFTWPGYTYEHTLRVRNLALALAGELGANETVVHLAGLLHDVGKPAGEPHAVPSAERAEPVMKQLGIDALTRLRVCYAIANHITQSPLHPIENLCLYDADLIDANFGYIAFTRYITIRAHREMAAEETIASAKEWLGRVDERRRGLFTEAGRQIAAARYARMWELYGYLERDLAAGDGPALRVARFIAADAARPSLARQMSQVRELGDTLESAGFIEGLLGVLGKETAADELGEPQKCETA